MSERSNASDPVDDSTHGKGPRRALPPGALCEEPFRLFFPIGVLIGISGVSLWPLYFIGLHKFYPGIMHARMMIEGFLGAFVVGFLGTAMPRLTGTNPFSRWELGSLLLLLLASTGLHIGHQHTLGDAAYLALLLIFGFRMASRFFRRTDDPPPSFILVAFGFFSALTGTLLLLVSSRRVDGILEEFLGRLLLYQGFLLFLVLGVGGFLLRRFLGLPQPSEPAEVRQSSGLVKRRALFASVMGVVVLASFALEVFTFFPKLAGIIRFLAVAVFLGMEIPFHRASATGMTVRSTLRVALLFLLLGILFPVLWPIQRVAGLHLIFIGGFTVITFTVATRVVLGHSGKGDIASGPIPALRWGVALLLIAAVLRVVGDFQPITRGRWLESASYAWMIGAAIWSWRILPNVRVPDTETEMERT